MLNTPLHTSFSSYNSYSTNINHPRISKHPNRVLSRPTPRSGWRVTLRRDVLAQASPPSPRRGLEEACREHHGISLRRDPSRLGEVFTRSKIWAGRLGDLSRIWDLGESLLISPRRDWLAWARFAGFAAVLLQQSLTPAKQQILTTDSTTDSCTQTSISSYQPCKLEMTIKP